jgi:Asp-tRNA(Asn)/Glu-tRNA(Gln) amidotransferase C subunit
VSFWETVCNSPTTNSDQVGRMTSSHDSVNIDMVSNPLNSLQVEAEVNDVHLDHTVNPPPGFPRLSRPASSVASSRTKNLRIAQNEAERIARLAKDVIDEEELELDAQEAAEAAKLVEEAAKVEAARLKEAAKAKANRSRARREMERKRFEVYATHSEMLAQIEDESNDLSSSHGLDAESIGNWVSSIHNQNVEASNASILAPYTLPSINNVVQSTVANVVPICEVVTPSSHNMIDSTSTSLINSDNVPLSIGDNVNSTAYNNQVSQRLFPDGFPAVSSMNIDALNHSSVP